MTKESGVISSGKALHPLQTETLGCDAERVLPVLQEQIEIAKVIEDTGAVRVRKIVHDETRPVDTTLVREEVTVTRVPVNKVVEAKSTARQDGDTLVIPVYKEIFVKQLILVEEVHVISRRGAEDITQPVTLKREEAIVERYEVESGSWKPDPTQ
jgi:uncharacterized protein (TIGR02271 family)